MKKIPKEDRLKFYKFLNAGAAFEKVEDICNYMQSSKIDESHILFYVLCLSIAVLYGRSFKQRKNIRLPELIIPKEFQSTHDFLILMRDKVFAHTDTDMAHNVEDIFINDVAVEFHSGEKSAIFRTLGINKDTIDEIRILSRTLAKKAAYHADKVWNKYMRNYPFPDGYYKVNIGDDDGLLLLPSKMKEGFT